MSIFSLNFENIQKLALSVSFVLMALALMVIPLTMWFANEITSDYVDTEIALASSFLEADALKTVNSIQTTRLELIEKLKWVSVPTTFVLLLGGVFLFLFGLLTWRTGKVKDLATGSKRRTTETDGVKREYWNSLFTEVQHIKSRLQGWSFKDKLSNKEIPDTEKMNLLLMYHQSVMQRKYTTWFIVLTIANVLVLLLQFFI